MTVSMPAYLFGTKLTSILRKVLEHMELKAKDPLNKETTLDTTRDANPRPWGAR